MTIDDSQIDDDEILYRRIPVSQGWYEDDVIYPEAFGPRRDEDTGISLTRKKFKSPEEAAQGLSKKGYYLAVLKVGDIRKLGLSVEFRPNTPNGHDPSHVEVSELNANTRKETSCLEAQESLASREISSDVLGPFLPGSPGS